MPGPMANKQTPLQSWFASGSLGMKKAASSTTKIEDESKADEKKPEQTAESQESAPLAPMQDPKTGEKHNLNESQQSASKKAKTDLVAGATEAVTEADSEPPKPLKKPAASIFSMGKNTAGDASSSPTKTGHQRPESYDPSKAKYHPVRDACWKDGEPVPYMALSRTFEFIEGTTKRLLIIQYLANFLESVALLTPNDLLPAVYLTVNKVAPDYANLELGLGDAIVMKAISKATGRSLQQLKGSLEKKGDLGLVAQESKANQRTMFAPKPLTVEGVFKTLRSIAELTGNASQTKKQDKISTLMIAGKGSEPKYLVRALSGKLRIGLAEQSVLMALARAATVAEWRATNGNDPKKATKDSAHLPESAYEKEEQNRHILKTVFSEHPNYENIVPALVEHGFQTLHDVCHISPGVPIKPMLAKPTNGVQVVLDEFEGKKFICEYKYDGERAQIHLTKDGQIQIYSRNSENHTEKYPDIVSNMPLTYSTEGDLQVIDFIMDCEAVAFDRQSSKLLPFQVLSTRKRKEVNEADVKVQVCLFGFDLLYINGTSLVTQPLIDRRECLMKYFHTVDDRFRFAKSLISSDLDEMQSFLDQAVADQCEGLMVKTLEEDATYEIAKRSKKWLKLKKDYLTGIGDTVDLVVLGAFYGKGKRTGVYGAFLLGCYDSDNEEYQAICKIGTGFSDEVLAEHHSTLSKHIIPKPKPYYQLGGITPDVWFDAVQVWEVLAADLSISPQSKAAAGLVHPEKGISLRFPRFVKIREDKKPEEATDSQQVADLYRAQASVQNGNTGGIDDDEY
eukprot:Clim_evm100s152 gene=Clim_evmTU100s152